MAPGHPVDHRWRKATALDFESGRASPAFTPSTAHRAILASHELLVAVETAPRARTTPAGWVATVRGAAHVDRAGKQVELAQIVGLHGGSDGGMLLTKRLRDARVAAAAECVLLRGSASRQAVPRRQAASPVQVLLLSVNPPGTIPPASGGGGDQGLPYLRHCNARRRRRCSAADRTTGACQRSPLIRRPAHQREGPFAQIRKGSCAEGRRNVIAGDIVGRGCCCSPTRSRWRGGATPFKNRLLWPRSRRRRPAVGSPRPLDHLLRRGPQHCCCADDRE